MAKRYPTMDAAEYEAARKHYGLTGVNFARLVGVGWRQAQRYQAGAPIPEPVARLIRTAIRNNLEPEEIG